MVWYTPNKKPETCGAIVTPISMPSRTRVAIALAIRNASLGCRANPTELTSAHLDELVALARRHKNRDRVLWFADDESSSLCDGQEHQGVRVNIRIKGGCQTTHVPFNSHAMSGPT